VGQGANAVSGKKGGGAGNPHYVLGGEKKKRGKSDRIIPCKYRVRAGKRKSLGKKRCGCARFGGERGKEKRGIRFYGASLLKGRE